MLASPYGQSIDQQSVALAVQRCTPKGGTIIKKLDGARGYAISRNSRDICSRVKVQKAPELARGKWNEHSVGCYRKHCSRSKAVLRGDTYLHTARGTGSVGKVSRIASCERVRSAGKVIHLARDRTIAQGQESRVRTRIKPCLEGNVSGWSSGAAARCD